MNRPILIAILFTLSSCAAAPRTETLCMDPSYWNHRCWEVEVRQ